MKRRFTILTAAFALLAMLAIPMGMWGQTRDEVVAYTLQPVAGSNNNYASNCDITIDDITWNLTGNSQQIPWRIGGKSLTNVDRPLYSKTAISDNISKIEVTHGSASSITVNSWTVIVASDADFNTVVSTLTPTFTANSTTTINRPDGVEWSNCYYKFIYNVSVSGSNNKYLEFTKAEFYKETGTTLIDSDLSLSPTELSFDLYDDADAKTITISTSSTGAITVSNNTYVTTQVDGTTITVTPVAVTPEAQTITVSQAADNTYNAGEASFTVSIDNSTPTYTITYKANGGAGDDIVDTYFEGENVTVRSNTFIYVGHAFTKWNTAANGAGDDYQPAATIENITANIELYAQWEESNEVVDVLTNSNTIGETTNNYSNWTATGTSGAEYSGNSAGGNGTIQFRSNNNNSGVVSTISGGLVKKVVVTWYSSTVSGRTLNVYGNNTAYTEVSSLYGEGAGTLLGTIVCGTNTELTINDDFEYIGLRSANGAMYLEDIRITWEPDSNPDVTTTVTINVPEGFNNDLHQGTTAGTLTATVSAGEEPISGATVTWTSSDTDVATINENGAITLIAVGTTTITADYAGVEGQYKPSSSTYVLNVIDSNAPGTVNNPYTVAQAIAVIDDANGETVNDKYVTGFVSNIETAYSTQYHNITFDIVDETGDEVFLRAYRCSGEEAANVQVGDIVVVSGNLYYYESGSLYEFAQGCQLVSLEHPQSTEPSITVDPATVSIPAEGAEGALTVTYENITDIIADVFFCDAEGAEATYEWITAEINDDNNIEYLVEGNDGEARTAYFKVYALDDNAEYVYSNLVTVSQAMAPITSGTGTINFGNSGTKINSASVTGNDDLGNTWTITTVGTTSFTQSTYYSQVGKSAEPAESITFATTLPVAATVSAFEAKFGGFNGTAGDITLKVDGTTYGTGALDGTNDVIASCLPMVSGTVLTVTVTHIAKGVKCYYISYSLGAETYTLYIPGYINPTDPDADADGGYYLIASPVSVNPANVEGEPEGMTDGNFDLYYFNQSDNGAEWKNYEANHFNLVPGKGYLYAHDTDVELTFTGAPYSGNGEFPLSYTEDAVFAGWNLMGNPYNYNVTVDKDFYIMNEDGDEIIPAEEQVVARMQGIFVVATAAGQTVTFSKYVTPIVPLGKLVLNLSHNRGTAIDRAIVRFGQGEQLPKFQLFENSTKLYIPQGNSDYAIIRSATEGEMPVNFKAKENGTYTISVNTENIEMDYLHLIDNMTGTDVDLLQTTSYTFEASTRDYASRFRLVFSAEENGASAGSATFAYFNGNGWVVSNEGDAQLHVIDMTGRIVSTETINGNATVKVNAAPGVYMLRLVNGDDIKTQKVIIK